MLYEGCINALSTLLKKSDQNTLRPAIFVTRNSLWRLLMIITEVLLRKVTQNLEIKQRENSISFQYYIRLLFNRSTQELFPYLEKSIIPCSLSHYILLIKAQTMWFYMLTCIFLCDIFFQYKIWPLQIMVLLFYMILSSFVSKQQVYSVLFLSDDTAPVPANQLCFSASYLINELNEVWQVFIQYFMIIILLTFKKIYSDISMAQNC